MNLLTDAEARDLLTNPLLNTTEVARLFYGPNPPRRSHPALMMRLRADPLTEDTLVRLSKIVFVYFESIAALHAKVAGDENLL